MKQPSVGQPSVVFVVGPTGIGKSALAIDISKRFSGEVVSADSMQVYRGMDIGTAKLSNDEMDGVAHHLIDVVDPTETYTAARWKQQAEAAIADIHARGRLPVVCGGTGLYVRALTDDLDFASDSTESPVRAAWRAFLDQHGSEKLHAALVERDPTRARELHPNDVKRVLRALEVHDTAEKPMSAGYDWSIRDGKYRSLVIGLTMPRESLYDLVDRRVVRMWSDGLVDEVAQLRRLGVTSQDTALQAIGYKEVVQFMEGELTEAQALDLIQRNTRRFVKRQLSWFRRDPRIQWFEKTDSGSLTNGEELRLYAIIGRFVEGISHESPE